MKRITVKEAMKQGLNLVSKNGADILAEDLKYFEIEFNRHNDDLYEIADNNRDWNYTIIDDNDVDISAEYIIINE